jgi:hypothetical protein
MLPPQNADTGEVALSGVRNFSSDQLASPSSAQDFSRQNAPNKIAPTNANTAQTASMFRFKVRSTKCSLLVDMA